MDGNKDEAIKCIAIAKEAIASGNKERALKFIAMAQRLNHNLNLDDLQSACENLDSSNPTSSNNKSHVASKPINGKHADTTNESANYTEEHVQLVRKIRRNTCYYEILGVEKTCSVDEIKKAYRKLSLKVHPDKNKAPGSEDAFKKVSKAFKTLSDEGSRRQYDHTGLGEGEEYNNQNNYNARRRRRRTGGQHMFEDEFDADEIFRSFFGQGDMFRAAHVYRTRAAGQPRQEREGPTGPNLILLLQLIPVLLIIVLACLPFSEPEYSLQRNYTYQFLKTTSEFGVEFYVKNSEFDHKYPVGSPGRGNIENSVVRDYKNILWRYCHVEMQRRTWNRNLPTPHCDKLQSLGVK